MVISHATGLSGTLVAAHCSTAATRASCARSSAKLTSRVIRVRAPPEAGRLGPRRRKWPGSDYRDGSVLAPCQRSEPGFSLVPADPRR